jgi:tetratricopeptide (TPR) repeat protein
MKTGAVALSLLLVAAPCARAGESPLALYLSGQYARAEAAGLAENDADGFAIAARAVLADDMMREQPCLDCLVHAEELSRKAIASDPKRPEGHIYLAAALGYRARIIGDIAAQSQGLASKAKRELDAALADDPRDPWALAAVGSWHIEIVRSAGPTLARWLFGARFAEGRDYYARALSIAPENLVLHYQYALVLAAYDYPTYRGEVENELALAVACSPGSSYEVFARKRASELLDTLKRGDTAEAQRLVHRDQGYPA